MLKSLVLFLLIIAATAACGKFESGTASGVTRSATTGAGAGVLATAYSRKFNGLNSSLTITCQESSTGTCHYQVWQVVSATNNAGNSNIERHASSFSLRVNESRNLRPALKDSSFCHASDKLPDPAVCEQTKT